MSGSCDCGHTHGEATTSTPQGAVLCYYEYRDEANNPLFRVVRYIGKKFSQERHERGKWIGGKDALQGVRRVIYRLPEILASQGPVLIVEGEKDADTGWNLGYPTTTNPHGALHWKATYNAALKDRDIIIIPDADDKGRHHAEQVREHLQGHAKSVRILELQGKDLTAWVEDGGSKEDLKRLISSPIDWKKVLKARPVDAVSLAPLIGKPIPYIVRPLVVRGSLTQLQGTQKGGKSAFANYLAFCAAIGDWQSNHFESPEAQRVLYISWEDPDIMIAQRLSLYAKGIGLGEKFLPTGLIYLFRPFFSIENSVHLEAAKQMVRELDIDILIIDTLAHIHGCDENAASEMRLPMANLAELAEDMQIGIVYLHHIAKMAGDRTPQDKSRGSGAIAAAWHVLIDWGVREEGSNVNPVQIQSKFLHKFLKWDIEYIHDGTELDEPTYVKWEVRSSVDTRKLPSKIVDNWPEIELLALKHPSGITRYDLANLLGTSPSTAKDHLNLLVSAGKMAKSVKGCGRKNQTLFTLTKKETGGGDLPPVSASFTADTNR
jgi:5S rRNA maturation endonuclease (ribonuclease M5)